MQLTSLPLTVVLLASTALAQGGKGGVHRKPPPNNITPHIVDGFRWTDPFPAMQESTTVEPSCEAVKHFFAQEYTLHDLEESEPLGLKQWANGLKALFKKTEYPGGWSGYDRHGYDRSILKMGYSDLPVPLKEWIEEQEKSEGEWKGLFGVFRKSANKKDLIEDVVSHEDQVNREKDGEQVVIFAPAAIYHTLPLWVAEESDCKDQLLDLSLYKPELEAGNVVGWADHKRPDINNRAEIRVAVNVLKAKEGAQGAKEEL